MRKHDQNGDTIKNLARVLRVPKGRLRLAQDEIVGLRRPFPTHHLSRGNIFEDVFNKYPPPLRSEKTKT